jgi:hypothetical protein
MKPRGRIARWLQTHLGVTIDFSDGTLAISNGNAIDSPLLSLLVYLPWVTVDPEKSDGWGGLEEVFIVQAHTELQWCRDRSIGYYHARLKILGFGLGLSYQRTY